MLRKSCLFPCTDRVSSSWIVGLRRGGGEAGRGVLKLIRFGPIRYHCDASRGSRADPTTTTTAVRFIGMAFSLGVRVLGVPVEGVP